MASPNPSQSLVILLHGVGSNGQNMEMLADALRPALPNTTFISPDAPFPGGNGAGRQWFSIAGVTEANRPQRIADARLDFDRLIGRLIEEHGFENRLDRVVLLGFSQGAMMLLDAIATGRWPVAAGTAFSGRLASLPPHSPSPNTRILLLHGSADPVVPSIELERAEAALKAAGSLVESKLFPGLGHSVSQEGLDLAGAFIATSLDATGKIAT